MVGTLHKTGGEFASVMSNTRVTLMLNGTVLMALIRITSRAFQIVLLMFVKWYDQSSIVKLSFTRGSYTTHLFVTVHTHKENSNPLNDLMSRGTR